MSFWHISNDAFVLTMSFVGGFVDVVGYVRLFGIFTSSITGNLIVAAAAVVETKQGVLCRALVCITFTVAGGIGAGIALQMKMKSCHQTTVTGALLICELVFFVAFWTLGALVHSSLTSLPDNRDSLDDGMVMLLANLMAVSMGLHAAVVKDVIPTAPATTVMTSNMITFSTLATQLIAFAIRGLSTPPDAALDAQKLKAQNSFPMAWQVLFTFTLGGCVGAVTSTYGQWHSMAIPVFLVICMFFEAVGKPAAPDKAAAETTVPF